MRWMVVVFLGLVLAAAAAIWVAFDRDVRSLNARLEGRSQIIDTSFGPLEYATAGEGAPVLVIHGTGGGFDQGLEMIGPLAERGYRLIAPSRFGYLRSPYRDDLDIAMQADAYVDLLDQLNIDKVAVLGGSAGALSAAQFAIRHPDRCEALVLYVPATYSPNRRPNESAAVGPVALAAVRAVLNSDFLFWAGVRLAPDRMTRLLLATEPAVVAAASPEEQARARTVLRHILPISRRVEGIWFDAGTAGNPPPMDLDTITCPVLAISAEDDLYGTAHSARHAADQVRDGRAVIYEDGGHLLVGHDDAAWREVSSFLEAAGGPAPREPGRAGDG